MLHKTNNNLVAKNLGKKKCFKFGLERFQISTRCYVNGRWFQISGAATANALAP